MPRPRPDLVAREDRLTVLPAVPDVSVQVMVGTAARAFLDTAWQLLFERTPLATPYQSPLWLAAHADRLAPTAELLLLVAEDATGRPRAAFAAVRNQTVGGWMEVTPLSTPAAEYVRIVGPDAEQPGVAAAIAEALTRFDADVMLPDVPASSALGRYISQWQHALTRCARVDLPVPYASMSRSTRRDHRRRQRDWHALAESGHCVTYHRTQSPAELLDAYTVLAHLHQLRRHDRTELLGLTSADERLRAVLERCADMAFIATLTLDGRAVAAQLCLHRGRHAYSMLPAMDPAHQDLAPGHALLRRLSDELTTAGYASLDLGRTTCAPGQAAYKNSYAPVWTGTLTAARRTLAGPDAMRGLA
ncbi:GNAT family N-acetyltransferase [Streptomyces sp. NBC_00829]|uniref:GNAT family N-acetyltransferase n=1 Tax=Streptomyces sp. NBC_00829 TaxID=2903679 RepID=UPI00386F2616|nr:GNAT family N-acetyltransferase [Streptomyces sp. NBC_00829]